MLSAIVIQFLNGLANASTLFLVAVGLSLIFGVTRIVNFAHGSLYMLGLYVAYTLIERLGVGAARVLGRRRRRRARGRGRGRADRDRWCCGASTTRPSCSSCSRPSRWCWSSRTRRCGSGAPEDLLGPRAPGLRGCGRDPRPAVPRVRPVPDRDRAARAGRAVAAAQPHALGHAGARRHAGPRDGGRARRQPEVALHRRVRARRVPGRAGRRAADPARAGATLPRPDRDRATPSSWWWSAAWAAFPAPSSPRC